MRLLDFSGGDYVLFIINCQTVDFVLAVDTRNESIDWLAGWQEICAVGHKTWPNRVLAGQKKNK